MNLTHLRYLVEVGETKSITKAAQNLYMGQPNLSKAIKDTEKEMGVTLFKRTAKGVEPTKRGMEFLTYAKSILNQVDQLEAMYKPQEVDSVKFSVCIPRATYVSVAFTKFLNRLPREAKINVYFKETNSMAAMSDVSGGEADLAIIRYQAEFEPYFMSALKQMRLQFEPLWQFKMALLMSRNHPLAKLDHVPYHMLSDCTEIAHGDVQVPSLSAEDLMQQEKLEKPAKRIYVYERGSQLDLLQRVPGTFMWVSPMPEDFLLQHEMVTRPCGEANIINKDILIYKRNHYLSDHEQLFVDTIKEATTLPL